MHALAFWLLVLPRHGWYVTWAKKDKLHRQVVCANLQGLLAVVSQLDAEGWDVYHACATFKEKIPGQAGQRAHENVGWLKSLFADIDTRLSHPNAKYADPEEAYFAVEAFCRMVGLPSPLYVSSGGGLHLYWPLTMELDFDTWTTLAGALKAAAAHYGLEADPKRTADASSVLRTPGTKHHKTGRIVTCGEPVKEYPLEAFRCLERFINHGQSHVADRRVRIEQPTGISRSLHAAITNVYGNDPSDTGVVFERCQQLRQLRALPGKYSDNFHWGAAGLAKECTPGSDAGLDYYVGGLDAEYWDAGYDKGDRWNRGPTTCSYFAEHSPEKEGCKGCVFYDSTKQGPQRFKITSPIILGRNYQVEAQTLDVDSHQASPGQGGSPAQPAPDPRLGGFRPAQQAPHKNGVASASLLPIDSSIELPNPEKWRWTSTGQLVVPAASRDGVEKNIVVSEHAIYLASVNAGETNGQHHYTFLNRLPHSGWKPITVPANGFWSGRAVPMLADNGAVIRDAALFRDFVTDSVAAWHHKAKRMDVMFEQCGWKYENTAFLIGQYLMDGKAISLATVNEELRVRSQWLGPQDATLDVRGWTSAMNQLIPEDHHAGIFAVLCSFGAPLMKFLAEDDGGSIVSLQNILSGVGKTTILKACGSVWGQMEGLEMTDYDTGPARGLTLAALGNLPAIFDELARLAKKKDPDMLREFIMLVTGGRDKKRSQPHGTGIRHTQGGWSTILLTASNESILDQLAVFSPGTDAPQMRVLELKVNFPQTVDRATGDRLIHELAMHGGLAGQYFMQHLLQPDVLAWAKQTLPVWSNIIWKQGRFRSEHRYWVRAIACACMAGELVSQLGLLRCKYQETIAWVIRMAQLKAELIRPTLNGEDLIPAAADGVVAVSEYVNEHIRNVLIVPTAHQPGTVAFHVPVDRRPSGRLLMRHEESPGRLYINQKEFRIWITTKGFSYSDVIEHLTNIGALLATRKATLGAGTKMTQGGQIPCVVLDLQKPGMGDVVAKLVEAKQAGSQNNV